MKGIIFSAAIIVVLAAGMFFLRGGLPFGQQQAAVSAPAAAANQQSAQPGQAAPPADSSAQRMRERRAERERAATQAEEFKPPPEIKFPDLSKIGETKPEEKKGGGGGFGEAWDRVTFPVRVIGWVVDNFWLLVIGAVALLIFSQSLFSKLIGLPFKVLGEIIELLFTKKAVKDAVKESNSADGGRRGRRRE